MDVVLPEQTEEHEDDDWPEVVRHLGIDLKHQDPVIEF
tara:strand:+ start:3352 stop:3465 length:114 start_codon:yes stop_codon:yes gene_type:complete